MRQIDAIHTLEDERFLVRMARMSVAVLLAGVGFAILWFAVSNSPLPICPLELNVALGPLGAAITGEPAASGWSVAGWWFALGAGCVVSFAAHELVHGFVFGRFMPAGHKVTYGGNLKKGILYASAEGVLFTRDQYLLVAAAPTIVITSLVAAAGWGFRGRFGQLRWLRFICRDARAIGATLGQYCAIPISRIARIRPGVWRFTPTCPSKGSNASA